MKNYVEIQHQIEEKFLSPFASKAANSSGRAKAQETDNLRTEFARDRDRILHSKAFRRLKHKTQVFLSPEGDHYRTRLTHTIEVSQIARTIARALRLNEDLTEAIALGHDLGHTPYGHAGEKVLNQFTPFEHNQQSLRVVDVLENDGAGLNLTHEVRDGILNHTSSGNPCTLEGHIVAWSDRIAYINHDIDDALRAGILDQSDIPAKYIKIFGAKHSQRINSMIMDIINNSFDKDFVAPSEKIKEHIAGLRQFMFDKVYTASAAKTEETKAQEMVAFLYNYYIQSLNKLPKFILNLDASEPQKVCDYISMMSDRFAVATYKDLTIPKGWSKL